MKRLATVACMMILTSCASRSPEMLSRHTSPDPDRFRRELSEIVIPEVSLRGANAADALMFWSELTKANDSQKKEVVCVISDRVVKSDEDPVVKISLNNVTSLDLLNTICRQAKYVWWLTPRCMMLKPREDVRPEPKTAPLPRTHQRMERGQ